MYTVYIITLFLHSSNSYFQKFIELLARQAALTTMESINLVKIVDQKIVINEAAMQELEKCEGPISIVSTCGDYRTGKSFLLNMLFSLNCFDVSPTTQPCTKGINMSKMPIQISNKKLWIFDTEGFGSMQQEGKYDAKIFLLAILFSQALIYNSVGSLDQLSISKMALICKQAIGMKKLLEQQDGNECSIKFRQIYFYWVLRDFALSLTNKDGDKINPDEYLEQSLSGQTPQRKTIRSLFEKRKCFPLVRPCISETSLQSLKTISINEIREEFKQEIQNIFQHIKNHIKSKKLFGKQLNGIQFVKLIKGYVKAINSSDFDVNLIVTWQKIQDYQRQVFLENVEQSIKTKIKKYQKYIPISEENLKRLKRQINQIVSSSVDETCKSLMREELQKIASAGIDKFQQKNNIFFKEQYTTFKSQNLSIFFSRMQKCSESSIQDLKQKFPKSFKTLNQSYKNFSTDFFNKHLSVLYNTHFLEQTICWIGQKILPILSREQRKKQNHLQKLQKQKIGIEEQLRHQNRKEEQLCKQIRDKQEEFEDKEDNYQEIIRRLEKVNENLRKEFEKLRIQGQDDRTQWESKITTFQEKIQEYQHLNQQLEDRLQDNESQNKKLAIFIQNTTQQHKIQLQEAAKKYLQLLAVQRQSFQSLLQQKRMEQCILKQQLQEAKYKNNRLYQELSEKLSKTQKQYESIFAERENQHKIEIDRLYIVVNEVSNRENLLKIQNQRLYQQIDNKMAKVEELNNDAGFAKKKYLSLQQQLIKVKEQLCNQKNTSKEISQKNMQLCQQLKQNHKIQLENLTKKLEQTLENSSKVSKQKYEISKKQHELQQKKIADKLIEAAERISVMTQKDKLLSLKLAQTQKSLEDKEKEILEIDCKYRALKEDYEKQSEVLLELEKQLQSYPEQQKHGQFYKTLKLNGQLQKGQLTIPLSSVERGNRQKTQREGSKSKRVELCKQLIEQNNQNFNPQIFAGCENIEIQTWIKSLTVQNELLKNQIQEQRIQIEKWKVQSLKKINLHSLMKKMQSGNTEQIYDEQEINKKIQQLQFLLSTQRQRTALLNHQIAQLHEVIMSLSRDLKNEEDSAMLTKSTLQQVLQEKEKIREIAEQSKASYEVKTRMMSNQIEDLKKKCNGWSKQVSIWKVKANNNTKKECEIGSGGSNYRGKINQLFNFL